MLDTAPNDAIVTLSEVYYAQRVEKLRTILLGDHLVRDVLWRSRNKFLIVQETGREVDDFLAELSMAPEWWLRMYVVEVMGADRILAHDVIVLRLRKDDNASVRDRAKQIAEVRDNTR
jgi:hypothetical protein